MQKFSPWTAMNHHLNVLRRRLFITAKGNEIQYCTTCNQQLLGKLFRKNKVKKYAINISSHQELSFQGESWREFLKPFENRHICTLRTV